jgi:hypothetical protein
MSDAQIMATDTQNASGNQGLQRAQSDGDALAVTVPPERRRCARNPAATCP